MRRGGSHPAALCMWLFGIPGGWASLAYHPSPKELPMLYAILAYHVEADVLSWTAEADAALMADLGKAHDRIARMGSLGTAAPLGRTAKPRPTRRPGRRT